MRLALRRSVLVVAVVTATSFVRARRKSFGVRTFMSLPRGCFTFVMSGSLLPALQKS
jgi:hypothetical protein